MLPLKIREFLVSLRERTETGALVWKYDDDGSHVSVSHEGTDVWIRYRFNMRAEAGQFRVLITEAETRKEHSFFARYPHDDFTVVRMLFDSAQASGMKLPM